MNGGAKHRRAPLFFLLAALLVIALVIAAVRTQTITTVAERALPSVLERARLVDESYSGVIVTPSRIPSRLERARLQAQVRQIFRLDTLRSLPDLSLNQIERGELISDINSYDFFRYAGTKGETIAAELSSEGFDPQVDIVNSARWMASDFGLAGTWRDDGPGTNLRVTATLPTDGVYLVYVGAFDGGVGTYTLTLRASDGSTPGVRGVDGRWLLMLTTDDSTWWIDTQRLISVGGIKEFWIRQVYEQEQRGRYDEVWTVFMFDCTSFRYRSGRGSYRLNGRVVDSFSPSLGEWISATPGSLVEALQEAVCN